jgi:Arc/MetJ-type ribon-helix-helix transcriptional regulator
MRKIINISLPEKLEKDVNKEIKKGNYASKSEFFRALLRDWQAGQLLPDINKSRAEIKFGKGKVLKSLKDLK